MNSLNFENKYRSYKNFFVAYTIFATHVSCFTILPILKKFIAHWISMLDPMDGF